MSARSRARSTARSRMAIQRGCGGDRRVLAQSGRVDAQERAATAVIPGPTRAAWARWRRCAAGSTDEPFTHERLRCCDLLAGPIALVRGSRPEGLPAGPALVDVPAYLERRWLGAAESRSQASATGLFRACAGRVGIRSCASRAASPPISSSASSIWTTAPRRPRRSSGAGRSCATHAGSLAAGDGSAQQPWARTARHGGRAALMIERRRASPDPECRSPRGRAPSSCGVTVTPRSPPRRGRRRLSNGGTSSTGCAGRWSRQRSARDPRGLTPRSPAFLPTHTDSPWCRFSPDSAVPIIRLKRRERSPGCASRPRGRRSCAPVSKQSATGLPR